MHYTYAHSCGIAFGTLLLPILVWGWLCEGLLVHALQSAA